MQKLLLLIALTLFGQFLSAQDRLPEMDLDRESLKAQLYFLASDFLAGRRTGSPGNDIAAHYIASHLQAYGFQPPAGQDNYFQPVDLENVRPPQSASLRLGEQEYAFGDDFIVLSGSAEEEGAEVVFAGHGWIDSATQHNDYADLDVRGKLVVTLPGTPSGKAPQAVFAAMSKKRQLAADRGAVALIELYQLPFPWASFKAYFGGENIRIRKAEEPALPYLWLKAADNNALIKQLQSRQRLKGHLASSGIRIAPLPSNNVVGILPGTDPQLRDEYLLLTAHFDHVGVGAEGGPYVGTDSIFNGARDNAFGTVALLAAARTLAAERPKRSIIVLAVTGEEVGLLGSNYYANNPLVPLEKTIFNLNTDGAGYSNTTAVSIIGTQRTGVDSLIAAGLAPFSLRLIADPAPEQGLFDRSDNVSFAIKGVPALTFSPAFEEFNAEISKYYHQATDNPDTIDYDYLLRFSRAYARTARLIANSPQRPSWVPGDKYEAAGKQLYGERR